jgi:hypothetical protein
LRRQRGLGFSQNPEAIPSVGFAPFEVSHPAVTQ